MLSMLRKSIVNNFLKKTSAEYHFWELVECVEYSEKTGKALKTPGLEVRVGANIDDAVAISALFNNLDLIGETICSMCIAYQASQETDERILEKLNLIRLSLIMSFLLRKRLLKRSVLSVKPNLLAERLSLKKCARQETLRISQVWHLQFQRRFLLLCS